MKLQSLSARFFTIVVWLVLLLTAGCGGGGGDSSPSNTTTATPKYTVMVYMVGSDLESGKDKNQPIGGNNGGAASTDLAEMGNVGSTTDLNVIVQTGGATRWLIPQISNTTVQRWRITDTGMDLKKDLGNVSMGDTNTLQDFITWTVANYPADKYMLVMWDHGSGAISTGGGNTFGFDENHNNDALSLPELKQALQNAYSTNGTKFDVIGFDACLMATLETAYTVSPYANYLVASEEIEPGHGWDYTAILSAIKSNMSISGNTLGMAIADGYKAQAQSKKTDSGITLSVLDLAKIPTVISNLESLTNKAATDLASAPSTAWITIAAGRSKAEDYGNSVATKSYTDMADLHSIASGLTSKYSEANALITAINQAVIYKVNGASKPNANGISIFFPYKNIAPDNLTTLTNMISAYSNIDFSTPYKNFLNEYFTAGQQDHTPPSFGFELFSGNKLTAFVDGGDVAEVDAVVTLADPTAGTVILLGIDNDVTVGQLGDVTYSWSGNWGTLNGNFVSLVPEDVQGSIRTYSIPALLNNQTVDILVWVDTSIPKVEVVGAWPGIVNGIAARQLIDITPGDVITPMFLSYDINSDTWQYVNGTAFIVGASGVQLGSTALPAGSYYIGFIAKDYAQNEQISQFVQVSVPSAAPSFKAAKANGSKELPGHLGTAIAKKIKEIRNHR